MGRKKNADFIFLERMPDAVKRAYLSEIKSYLYSNSGDYLNKDWNGTLNPVQLAELLLLATRIHLKVETYADFVALIAPEDPEKYLDDPDYLRCIADDDDAANIYAWSLAKDLIALNYKICIAELSNQSYADICERKDKETALVGAIDEDAPDFGERFEEVHLKKIFRWYKKSPFILDFFKQNFIDEDLTEGAFAIWANSVEDYAEFNCSEMTMWESDDDDFKEQLSSFEEVLCEDAGEGYGLMPLNALYFTGSPDGLRAVDYIGMLVKAYGFAAKASSIGKAGMALFSLSNPVTGIMGLASLGITGANYLAKNKEQDKRRFKGALAHTHSIIYQNARELITTFTDEIYQKIFDYERDCFKAGDLQSYHAQLMVLHYAANYLETEIEDCRRAQLEIGLPVLIDRRRLKAITAGKEAAAVRAYVESCYYPEDYEDETARNRLRLDTSLNDLHKLNSIFKDLGYFSITGIAKKALGLS